MMPAVLIRQQTKKPPLTRPVLTAAPFFFVNCPPGSGTGGPGLEPPAPPGAEANGHLFRGVWGGVNDGLTANIN
jgi:hypothetical protein